MALERAAEALVLRRLIAADKSVFERESSRGLLDDLRNARYRTPHEMAVRLHAAGMPVLGRRLQAVVVTYDGGSATPDECADLVSRSLDQAGARALTSPCADGVAGLIAWDSTLDPSTRLTAVALGLRATVRRLEPTARMTVMAGRLVTGVDDVSTSFREAEQVAAAAPYDADLDDRQPVVTLRDVGIRGLIAMLRDDPRLQLFIEDIIGPLLNRTSGSPSRRELLDALDAYLGERGNKSSAAARLHMSRPAFYSRLEIIERLLHLDLEDAPSVLAVHFALVAHDVLAQQ